ncbi:C45 family peptidase [Sulfitobacter sp. HNIBRBA2951]|uniref:C45 family peptidase n=1 Tax=Sulfitobacter aquimarinus TaxID=3158557 RepID=UPI0032DF90E1
MQPTAKKAHKNFHVVEASDPREMGQKLGSKFGSWTQRSIEEQCSQDSWLEKRSEVRRLLPLIEKWAGDLAEEIDSYSQAAQVDLIDAWVLSTESEFDKDQAEKCTTILSNDGQLLAHNEDWSADASDSICVLKRKIGEFSVFEFHYYAVPLGGTAFSVNSFGLCSAVNSLPVSTVSHGLPRNVVARLISHSCDAEAALAIIRDVPRYSGYNYVLSDTHGTCLNIECSADDFIVTEPSFPYVHTNHYRHLSGMPAVYASDSSYERLERVAAEASENMTKHRASAILHDCYPVFSNKTIGSVVVDIETWSALVWLKREKELGWLSYPLPT